MFAGACCTCLSAQPWDFLSLHYVYIYCLTQANVWLGECPSPTFCCSIKHIASQLVTAGYIYWLNPPSVSSPDSSISGMLYGASASPAQEIAAGISAWRLVDRQGREVWCWNHILGGGKSEGNTLMSPGFAGQEPSSVSLQDKWSSKTEAHILPNFVIFSARISTDIRE